MELLNEEYWNSKYENQNTGWDLGEVSPPLKEYIDQLENKNLTILIPGCGNGYEAEYLINAGFKNTHIIDISESAISRFKKRVPQFPKDQIFHDDFFKHHGTYDLILEQTFFCALNPSLRELYVAKMNTSLKPNGKLVGLLFNIPLFTDHPPFGGKEQDYRPLFQSSFTINTMKTAINSIGPRSNNELFMILVKK